MSIESNLADEKGEGDTFFGKLLKPGNDLLGYILIITSFVIWAEGNNLRSLNIIAVIIVIFWLFVNLLTKTRLFIKKEKDPSNPSRKRKLKILSLMLVIIVALLILSTATVLNFAEDFGADPTSHDSPNFNDERFENSEPTDLSSEEVSSWDLLADYMVSDDCRSPNEELPSEKFKIINLECFLC